MTHADILRALKKDPMLTTMLAETIGERAVAEDPESDATWETIGRDAIDELLAMPMAQPGWKD